MIEYTPQNQNGTQELVVCRYVSLSPFERRYLQVPCFFPLVERKWMEVELVNIAKIVTKVPKI